MRVIRSSNNQKIMLQIDTEAERQLVDRLFKRGLNCWEPTPPALLAAHEALKRSLSPPSVEIECRTVTANASDAFAIRVE